MRNGQNDQKTVKCVKEFFFIKLTKACKENQEWHILYIRRYDAINVETQFNHPKLYNFMNSWEMVKMTKKLWIA